jgi:hypothetical protein
MREFIPPTLIKRPPKAPDSHQNFSRVHHGPRQKVEIQFTRAAHKIIFSTVTLTVYQMNFDLFIVEQDDRASIFVEGAQAVATLPLPHRHRASVKPSQTETTSLPAVFDSWSYEILHGANCHGWFSHSQGCTIAFLFEMRAKALHIH